MLTKQGMSSFLELDLNADSNIFSKLILFVCFVSFDFHCLWIPAVQRFWNKIVNNNQLDCLWQCFMVIRNRKWVKKSKTISVTNINWNIVNTIWVCIFCCSILLFFFKDELHVKPLYNTHYCISLLCLQCEAWFDE
jgi:hypothetical protein